MKAINYQHPLVTIADLDMGRNDFLDNMPRSIRINFHSRQMVYCLLLLFL